MVDLSAMSVPDWQNLDDVQACLDGRCQPVPPGSDGKRSPVFFVYEGLGPVERHSVSVRLVEPTGDSRTVSGTAVFPAVHDDPHSCACDCRVFRYDPRSQALVLK